MVMQPPDPVPARTSPLQHAEEARRRAQLALYAGEHHHLPGGGYLPGVAGGLLRGSMVAGAVIAAGAALAIPPGLSLALLTAIAAAHALAEGFITARASAMQVGFYRREILREATEIEKDPEGERLELMALYEAKGLRADTLRQAVDQICADPDTLLKVMMEEELGIFASTFEHPAILGVVNGAAALLGALPLCLAFALAAGPAFPEGIPLAATGAWLATAAFSGVLRARHSLEPRLEAMAINSTIALSAGGIAYFLGTLAASLFTA